nr:unnamed protein product [Naegleria fowleri]
MNIEKLCSIEKSTPLDDHKKRQQIAGMFQKLVKEESHVRELEQFNGFVNLKQLAISEDSLTRKRAFATMCNISAIETCTEVMRIHNCIQLLCERLNPQLSEDVSVLENITSTLLNTFIDAKNREWLKECENCKQYLTFMIQTLEEMMKNDHASMDEQHNSTIYNLLIAFSSIALEESLSEKIMQFGGVTFFCQVISNLKTEREDYSEEIMEGITASLWNLLLIDSVKKFVMKGCENKIDTKQLIEKLIGLSNSKFVNVKRNTSHIIQILSSNTSDDDDEGTTRNTSESNMDTSTTSSSSRTPSLTDKSTNSTSTPSSFSSASSSSPPQSQHSHFENLFESSEMIQKLISDVKQSSTSSKIIDPELIKTSSGILWNMAGSSPQVRLKIRQLDGIPVLVNVLLISLKLLTLRQTSQLKEVIYKITGALTCLSLDEQNSLEIGSHAQVIPSLLNSFQFLKDGLSFSVLENLLTLLNNLSIVKENRKQIHELKGIPMMIQFLKTSNSHHTPSQEELKLAEKATNVLTNMAIDDDSSNSIREEGGIEKLVELVSLDHLHQNEEKDDSISTRSTSSSNNSTTTTTTSNTDTHNTTTNINTTTTTSTTTNNNTIGGKKHHPSSPPQEEQVNHVKKKAAHTLWNLMIQDENLKKIEQVGGLKPLVHLLPQTNLEDLVESQLRRKEQEEDEEDALSYSSGGGDANDDDEHGVVMVSTTDDDDIHHVVHSSPEEEEEVMVLERKQQHHHQQQHEEEKDQAVNNVQNQQQQDFESNNNKKQQRPHGDDTTTSTHQSSSTVMMGTRMTKEQSQQVRNLLRHWGSISEEDSIVNAIKKDDDEMNKEVSSKTPFEKTLQVDSLSSPRALTTTTANSTTKIAVTPKEENPITTSSSSSSNNSTTKATTTTLSSSSSTTGPTTLKMTIQKPEIVIDYGHTSTNNNKPSSVSIQQQPSQQLSQQQQSSQQLPQQQQSTTTKDISTSIVHVKKAEEVSVEDIDNDEIKTTHSTRMTKKSNDHKVRVNSSSSSSGGNDGDGGGTQDVAVGGTSEEEEATTSQRVVVVETITTPPPPATITNQTEMKKSVVVNMKEEQTSVSEHPQTTTTTSSVDVVKEKVLEPTTTSTTSSSLPSTTKPITSTTTTSSSSTTISNNSMTSSLHSPQHQPTSSSSLTPSIKEDKIDKPEQQQSSPPSSSLTTPIKEDKNKESSSSLLDGNTTTTPSKDSPFKHNDASLISPPSPSQVISSLMMTTTTGGGIKTTSTTTLNAEKVKSVKSPSEEFKVPLLKLTETTTPSSPQQQQPFETQGMDSSHYLTPMDIRTTNITVTPTSDGCIKSPQAIPLTPTHSMISGVDEYVTSEYIDTESYTGEDATPSIYEVSTCNQSSFMINPLNETSRNEMMDASEDHNNNNNEEYEEDEEDEDDLTFEERDDMTILQNIGVESCEDLEDFEDHNNNNNNTSSITSNPTPSSSQQQQQLSSSMTSQMIIITSPRPLLSPKSSQKSSFQISQEKRVEQIIWFYETEKLYTKILEIIDSTLVSNDSLKNTVLGRQAHSEIFSDFDCIRMINKDLFHELDTLYTKCQGDAKLIDEIQVGRLILKRIPTLRLYKTYCNNLEKLLQCLTDIESNNANYMAHYDRLVSDRLTEAIQDYQRELYKYNSTTNSSSSLGTSILSGSGSSSSLGSNSTNAMTPRSRVLSTLVQHQFNSSTSNSLGSSNSLGNDKSMNRLSLTSTSGGGGGMNGGMDKSKFIRLSQILSKSPFERIQFYVNWLQEMAYKFSDATYPDQKCLQESHEQMQAIFDHCLNKFNELEKLERFSQMLDGNFLSQNRRYYTMDNLGFPEPQNINEYKLYQQWKKSYDVKCKKVKKEWSKKNLSEILSNNSGIKNLIKKYGISASFRPRVWMEISGAQQKLNENTGYYKKILSVHTSQMKNPWFDQIEKDLKRTYVHHPFFNDEKVLSALRRVLIAYCWRNPLVSYSQSFNYIAGLLLLHLSEEEVFWLFVAVLEDYLPANYYSPELKGVLVDALVFEELLSVNLYKLSHHFKNLDFDISTFTMSFFMKLFTVDFPVETTLRFWDAFLCYGSQMMFRTILAMLKLNQDILLKTNDVSEIMLTMQDIVKTQFDVQKIMKTAFGFSKITHEKVQQLRKKYLPLIEMELERQRERRR